ncbi:MAG: oligosaccharide flippase family protein, partial [Kofleriaceae bacterium]
MAGTAEQRDARAFVIDTVVVAVTQLILRLRGLILLPLLVGLLGTAAYGVWAQIVAFAMFLSAFVSLNFHLPLVREIAEDRSRAASHYTTLLIATVLISAAVAGAIALVPGPIAATLLDSADQSSFIQLGLVLMVSSNVRILNVNLYRATGRLMIRSVVELAAALGELGGTVIVLYEGGTLHDVLVFMAAWNGGIAVAQSIHCFRVAGVASPQMKIVKDALIYSAPLVPASLANIALDRMDRFVVGHYFGTEGVGIYAANYAIGGLVMMVQTPFQMTLLPKVSELWHRDRERAARYIQISLAVFMALAVPFVVGVPIIADRILLVIGNEKIAADAGWSTFFIAAGVMLWGAAVMHAQVFYGA